MWCPSTAQGSEQVSSLQNYVGSGLWYRMYTSFGYLNTVGYASHLFPIVMVRSLVRTWALLRHDQLSGHPPVELANSQHVCTSSSAVRAQTPTSLTAALCLGASSHDLLVP